MQSPIPYLVVVWAVSIYLLHVAVFYLVYLGWRQSDEVESTFGTQAEGVN